MSVVIVSPTVPTVLHVLARYVLPDEDRVVVGRRIQGECFLYDYPADGQGQRYFVERGFGSKAELAVLLADYRREAMRRSACPMSREAIRAV